MLVLALGLAAPRAGASAQEVRYVPVGPNFELSVSRLTVSVDESWGWSARPFSIGSPVDMVEAQSTSGRFSLMIEPSAAGVTCRDAVRAAAARAGVESRAMTSAPYAPSPPVEVMIETSNRLAMFCVPLTDRVATFIVDISHLPTGAEQAVRMLALAVASAGTGMPSPAELGLTESLSLPDAGLTVPVEPASRWSVTRMTVRGTRIDQLTSPGLGGVKLSAGIIVLTNGSTCGSMARVFVSTGGRQVSRPPWIDGGWDPSVVATGGGFNACLPLRGRVIMATLSSINDDEDAYRIRLLLAGLRSAAYQRWGAP